MGAMNFCSSTLQIILNRGLDIFCSYFERTTFDTVYIPPLKKKVLHSKVIMCELFQLDAPGIE